MDHTSYTHHAVDRVTIDDKVTIIYFIIIIIIIIIIKQLVTQHVSQK